MKYKVLGIFGEFNEQGSFERSRTDTFMIFIPMKGGVEDLKDLKFIHLVRDLYKLLTKVLSDRIKVMGKKLHLALKMRL